MRENQPSAVVYELLADLGACVGLDATLALLDSGLRRLLPFDAMVVFLPRQDGLFPAYTSPSAHGSCHPRKNGAAALAGTIAAMRRPVFHSNSAQESGGEPYRSVLAVPLDDGPELAAVLALYALEHGVFQPEDLGVLLWMRADLARAIRHALRHPQSSTVDAALSKDLLRLRQALQAKAEQVA